MSSNQSGEGDIRKAIIEADLVNAPMRVEWQFYLQVMRFEGRNHRDWEGEGSLHYTSLGNMGQWRCSLVPHSGQLTPTSNDCATWYFRKRYG